MRPLQSLIPLAEARRIVLETVRPVDGTERVPLERAAGRVLAADLRAAVEVPPFARSAMDGYAVRAADTAAASPDRPAVLLVGELIHAGRAPSREVGPGACALISTGAPVPGGADAVVKVEDTEAEGGRVRILAPARPGENVAPAGEDIRPGDLLLRAGAVLTPARIGAAAAVGAAALDVFRLPRTLIFTTGDEVRPPGGPLPPGAIYDINSFTLGALLDREGLPWERGGNVADDPAAVLEALDRGRAFDLVLLSGGSSAGDRDLLEGVLARAGTVRFHGIALKPGKPTLFGEVRGVPVFGMPGFPASCLAVGLLLVAPAARRMARLPPAERRTVRAVLASGITPSPGRHQIFTVRLEGTTAIPAYKESGDITSLSAADGYVEIPPGAKVLEAGREVEVVLFP
ncbi:MAG: molybdopterin molybdotransferase MoeA [Planctomycetes bacterium]|jgi:molybdenum cofactor synthesis domain-containing protein|nr:molybdopterin molybdotransferase MoeA [Planctomycetota bacterium]